MSEPGAEETGLNLIHDTASAAGGFPHSVWGYDRQTVDSYVQELEEQLSAAKQLIRHMQREVAESKRVAEASDLTKVSGYTTQMLQAAEGQSVDLVDQAGIEAERIKAEGRRLAAESRASGEQEADDIRLNAQATFKRMRAEVDIQCARELDRARQQANSMLESARAQVDHQIAESQRAADALTEAAKLEGNQIKQSAATEVAEAKLAAEQAREKVLGQLAEEHKAAAERVATLLEKSRTETEAASKRLQDEVTAAADVRRKAEADAEEIRVTATRESEAQIAKAHAQTTLLRDRAEEQFGWRKEQLERETNRLAHRKQAILAQLANLSALAEHSLAEFPDLLAATDPATQQADPSANEPTTAVPSVDGKPQVFIADDVPAPTTPISVDSVASADEPDDTSVDPAEEETKVITVDEVPATKPLPVDDPKAPKVHDLPVASAASKPANDAAPDDHE